MEERATVRRPAEDEGNPFQTAKNMAEEGCSGSGDWVNSLRVYKGTRARSQRLTQIVHDINRVTSYSENLRRMENWETALEECVKDTGGEVTDVIMANGLR